MLEKEPREEVAEEKARRSSEGMILQSIKEEEEEYSDSRNMEAMQ